MNNILKLTGAACMLILASCSSTPKAEETQTTPAPVVNETTIIHEAPKPAEPAAPVETKSTTVTINKDGSSFETKDGSKGTKVEVKKGATEVIIKK